MIECFNYTLSFFFFLFPFLKLEHNFFLNVHFSVYDQNTKNWFSYTIRLKCMRFKWVWCGTLAKWRNCFQIWIFPFHTLNNVWAKHTNETIRWGLCLCVRFTKFTILCVFSSKNTISVLIHVIFSFQAIGLAYLEF